MDRDQCVARDFLGLAGNAGGGDVRRRNNSNSNSNAHVMMNHSNNNNNSTSCSSRGGGEMEAGMHGSGRPGVVRPSPVPYQDAGEASAARLRQMGEPTGQQQQHLSSAFGSSNGRSGYRSPPVFNGAVAPGMPGVNSSSIKGSSPLPGGPPPSMPDYLPGQWAALEKVQSLAHLAQAQAAQAAQAAAAQGHNNFSFDRSSSKEFKDRGNYVSREDISHGSSFDVQAQLALAASQAQFAANSRRFGVAPPTGPHAARPLDDRNTMARPAERPGMVHDSSLSLSIGGGRDHHPVAVNNFRVPSASAATASSNGGPPPGSSNTSMGAPRSPPVHHVNGNGMVVNGLTRPTTSNSPGRPPSAQLTIFYGGSVNVYDDVPIDKAQAIMLLAGTGSSFSTTIIHTPVPQSSPNSPSSMAGSQLSSRPEAPVSTGTVVQQQLTPPKPQVISTPAPLSAPQLPVSASSGASQATGLASVANQHEAAGAAASATASAAAATNASVTAAANPAAPTGASANKAPRRAQGPFNGEMPQARKLSVVRFLEKRRERAGVRQKNVYYDKREGSPQLTKSSSPPRSPAVSPQRPQDGSTTSLAASNQGEVSQQSKTPMQIDEPERGEESDWSKVASEQKKSPLEGSSSPIKAA